MTQQVTSWEDLRQKGDAILRRVLERMQGALSLRVPELLGHCDPIILARYDAAGFQFLTVARGVLERRPLTDRETEVGTLAAQGLTSRQIAQTLGLSRSTVETHLGHVFEKLRIASRRELTPARLSVVAPNLVPRGVTLASSAALQEHMVPFEAALKRLILHFGLKIAGGVAGQFLRCFHAWRPREFLARRAGREFAVERGVFVLPRVTH